MSTYNSPTTWNKILGEIKIDRQTYIIAEDQWTNTCQLVPIRGTRKPRNEYLHYKKIRRRLFSSLPHEDQYEQTTFRIQQEAYADQVAESNRAIIQRDLDRANLERERDRLVSVAETAFDAVQASDTPFPTAPPQSDTTSFVSMANEDMQHPYQQPSAQLIQLSETHLALEQAKQRETLNCQLGQHTTRMHRIYEVCKRDHPSEAVLESRLKVMKSFYDHTIERMKSDYERKKAEHLKRYNDDIDLLFQSTSTQQERDFLSNHLEREHQEVLHRIQNHVYGDVPADDDELAHICHRLYNV